LSILVVDDSPMSRKMLVKTLKQAGHTCEEAEDGQVAVDRVKGKMEGPREGLYDAILMDFVMVSEWERE
jgi:CheY-like chemotaxis protein